MVKLLLADDEPLVLIGLQSMLKWSDYDIEICGSAHNGQEALDMIGRFSPDLVIADIKMPLMSGLEAMKASREKYGQLPLFILLTSFEEFKFVKEAISYQAVEYLVKIDLTPQTLADAVSKALNRLRELKGESMQKNSFHNPSGMQPFYDRFFVRLLNNMFEDEKQFLLQKQELGLDFSFAAYATCYCEILGINTETMSAEKLVRLYSSTIRMVKETINKFMACYITSLDMKHFVITFCLSEQEVPEYRKLLQDVLGRSATIVRNYFSVGLTCAVGTMVENAYQIGHSFYTARIVFPSVRLDDPVMFYNAGESSASENDAFDFSRYKAGITKSFEELDTDALYDSITSISEYFLGRPDNHVQAMDAACNLLYMAVSLLPDGEDVLNQIFTDDEEGYRCIYKKRTTVEIVEWMLALRDGLCELLKNRKQNYKSRIVLNVQKYIRENLEKRLSLNEVAAVFGFSPNYLSQLFAKYAGCSFVEYTTSAKIAAAKEMMGTGSSKIYEIADRLGFESAFYFSKVFKKSEGCSPREYMQKHTEK